MRLHGAATPTKRLDYGRASPAQWSSLQQSSPRQASRPSDTMNQVKAIAAMGSAHHQPNAAFAPRPTRAVADSHMQVVVWNASETIARLRTAVAARLESGAVRAKESKSTIGATSRANLFFTKASLPTKSQLRLPRRTPSAACLQTIDSPYIELLFQSNWRPASQKRRADDRFAERFRQFKSATRHRLRRQREASLAAPTRVRELRSEKASEVP